MAIFRRKVDLPALGALLFATDAFSQSPVTRYGLVDDGVRCANNHGGRFEANTQNGALGGSDWGLLGAEDIGSVLKDIFRLGTFSDRVPDVA
ncbi:hypothetical protein [Caballeronia sp. dw_19]|uniref:hypothetical protein n=1 Tax=Caballeronia sp. dw_19 TaxID=2719791 RepID=UPI001BCAA0D2|nr:hypothetical protein [Caballeronia sp. dw_19]